MKYENYIFDLYGTLVDIHTDEGNEALWQDLADYYGRQGATYSSSEIKEAYDAYCDELCQEVEEIQIDKVFRRLYTEKGISPSDALVLDTCVHFRKASTEYLRLYDWSLPMLKQIKADGKKVYLLSNAQHSFTMPELEMLGLVPYFDDIFISSDCEVKKPNLAFFEKLIKRHDLDVKKCLFVGNDEICDVFGAQRAGMDTFYIHSNISPDYTGKVRATYMEMDAMKKADLRLP